MTNQQSRSKFFGVKTVHRDGTIAWRFIDCAKGGKAVAEASAEALADRFERENSGASSEVVAMTASEVMALRAAHNRPTLAPKPQNFDTSELPLFGDGHKQKELF